MTTAAPTSTAAVAEELVAFCRAGRNIDAIDTLYSPDIVSVESMGNAQMPAETRGLDAIRKKLGEPGQIDLERDYLERLLDRL